MNRGGIVIAEVRSAGDGCEAAETLANWMVDAFADSCNNCRAEVAHQLAVDMLPLVRPDLFDRWEPK